MGCWWWMVVDVGGAWAEIWKNDAKMKSYIMLYIP
jgi:hypothetical protein